MKNLLKLAGGLGLLGAVLLLERRRPLRVEKESKLRRVGRNLAVGALGAITIHFVESPLLTPIVGSGNSEPLIPEILSRSAVEGEASSKFR
jgi:hypothetical protein